MQTCSPRRSSAKAAVWKMPEPYLKEIHLLIVKCLPKGQESVRTHFRSWHALFLHSSLTFLVLALASTILHTPSNLLVPTGAPCSCISTLPKQDRWMLCPHGIPTVLPKPAGICSPHRRHSLSNWLWLPRGLHFRTPWVGNNH